jgi:hypothetical protein
MLPLPKSRRRSRGSGLERIPVKWNDRTLATLSGVIPAKAGIQYSAAPEVTGSPAFAGDDTNMIHASSPPLFVSSPDAVESHARRICRRRAARTVAAEAMHGLP